MTLNDICKYKGKGVTYDFVDKLVAIQTKANETLKLDPTTLVSTFSSSKLYQNICDLDSELWLKPTEELTEMFVNEVSENGIYTFENGIIDHLTI
jgi:hypothetical protein